MYFDEVATKWDTPKRIERAKILSKFILDKFNNMDTMSALEIGCGTGLITLELNNAFKEIYCVDTSKEMLNALKSKVLKYELSNVYPCEIKSIYNDNFYKGFNVIYSSMVFHHITDIESELKILYGLLKKDGYLIIIDLDEEDGRFHKNEKGFCGHNGFKREYLKEILEKCNFNEITFETIFKDRKEFEDEIIEYSLFLCLAKI